MRVKVWSVTMLKDRELLGEKITEWLRLSRAIPADTHVLQSSDSAFHCLSVVMFYDLDVDKEPSSLINP